MEYQPLPERGETVEPIFYNCSECFAPIEIIKIDNNSIKIKCFNENNPHEKEMTIKEYIYKMSPNIKSDICFKDNHNKKYEYFCFDCKTHLCENCIESREHINHNKIILKEISPNKNELKLIERIIEEYKNKNEDLKQLYELVYKAYNNFINNYYFMININNILINYINNNPDYKKKLSEQEYNNIINIKIGKKFILEHNNDIKKQIFDYKNKIEDLKNQLIDIQKEKENKDKQIKDLKNHLADIQKDTQIIIDKILEQNEKEIKNLKENNIKYEKEIFNLENEKYKIDYNNNQNEMVKKYEIYTNKTLELFKNIIDELNSINIILKVEKNNDFNDIKIENVDIISNFINEELKQIKNFISDKIENKNENIIENNEINEYKNIINIKYFATKKGIYNIFGSIFIKNNKDNIDLIINNKNNVLIDKYELEIGENIVTINIKNNLTNISYMFYDCKTLIDITELTYLDIRQCNNFEYMFYNCSSLSNIKPLENWNISNINNFGFMFCRCSSLSDITPLENWNTSNVNDFGFMFCKCYSLSDIKPLEHWNVSKGNNFGYMFCKCYSLSDIKPLDNWNVSKDKLKYIKNYI